MSKPTANILLRSDPALHKRLMAEAKSRDLSLHELCLRRVTIPGPLESSRFDFLRAPMAQAAELFGADFIGALIYGSQARGEGRSTSDWDLMVLVSHTVAINRALYRRWDAYAQPLDERLEVHFAHVPEKASVATSLWGEIALDGIVLFDDDFRVARHLNRVRQDIIAGLIIRKVAHGQSYWVHREVA